MRILLATVAFLSAGFSSVSAQPLVCQPVAALAGRPCEVFHYHVLLFRPDTRGFVEVNGINQFASQSACDRARDTQFKRNAAVVEFFHMQRHAEWWLADKFGPCHCDMTVEKTSPDALTDSARLAQLQLAEEIRERVRERLLDAGVPSDSELIRNLGAATSPSPMIGGPKVVAMPAAASPSSLPNPSEDLRASKAADSAQSSTSSLDLPLAEIPLPGISPDPQSVAAVAPVTVIPPAPAPATTVSSTPAPTPVTVVSDATAPSASPAAAPSSPAPSPTPASASAVDAGPSHEKQTTPAPASSSEAPSVSTATALATVPASSQTGAPDEANLPAPEDVADAFISYESQRIQNVLKVSGSIADESVKAQVLDACTQRIQLLSNLRSIIVGSGARSRLVAAANGAKKESDRLAVVSRLFGDDVVPHWAPKDAADVIFDPGVSDPETVLRGDHVSGQQKRHALYALLATSSPTEQQQLWLTSVIEGLLR